MIATVAEENIAMASSPGVVSGNTTAEMNQQQHDQNNTQQPSSFCDANKSTETTSRVYTDVEDTTFQKQMEGIPDVDDAGDNSSYWDLLVTVYVPLIVLWFRRVLFGQASLIRTLVVGQLMRLVFVDDISEWMSEKIPPWLEVILFQTSSCGGGGSGKVDPHAWPPPAFTALAMLTIFALVVHPDGLTWVLLGKVRDAIYAFFSALGQSLEFLLNDYGVLPTIIAATALSAMFFLVFIVIRTLSPKGKNLSDKQHNNTLHNERKKKKKKGGNARHRNNHHHRSNNRIKSSLRSQPQNIGNENPENDSTTAEARPCSPIPSPPPVGELPENEDTFPSSMSAENNAVDGPLEVPSLSAASSGITENNSESRSESINSIASDYVPISNGLYKSTAKEGNKTRRRVTSASTADTTPLSDDQSCGSTSVRSFPSVSVNSNRSGGKKVNSNNKGSTPRRLKRNGTAKSPKNAERNFGKKNRSTTNSNAAPTVESPGTSRWDALKPDNGSAGKNNNNAYGHHNHSNGTPGNKKQNQRHRGNSRRNTNGNGRKGRQHPKSFGHNEEPSPVSGSLRVNHARSNTNEVSPIGAMRHDSRASPNNPFAHSSPSLPSPPPGFNATRNEFESKPSDLQYRHQRQNHDLLATPLFETPLAMRSPQNNSITGVSPEFFKGSDSAARIIQENPFRSDVHSISGSSIVGHHSSYQQQQKHQAHLDSQIEADLQELGGQMAGSILDF